MKIPWETLLPRELWCAVLRWCWRLDQVHALLTALPPLRQVLTPEDRATIWRRVLRWGVRLVEENGQLRFVLLRDITGNLVILLETHWSGRWNVKMAGVKAGLYTSFNFVRRDHFVGLPVRSHIDVHTRLDHWKSYKDEGLPAMDMEAPRMRCYMALQVCFQLFETFDTFHYGPTLSANQFRQFMTVDRFLPFVDDVFELDPEV